MNGRWRLIAAAAMLAASTAAAAAAPASGAALNGLSAASATTPYLRLLVGLSLLSFIPAALVAMTSFTRIIVTLSFLRHALGMPETPPNAVLITLALFLTFFTMGPTLERCFDEGVSPFLQGKVPPAVAIERGVAPLREFMGAHVRDADLQTVAEVARAGSVAATPSAVPLRVLVPAFMLSELRAAFTAGFILFLPFLLIDLVVAAILMALGMLMVPPVTISLPIKLLLFVLIDGWSLLFRAIGGAYIS